MKLRSVLAATVALMLALTGCSTGEPDPIITSTYLATSRITASTGDLANFEGILALTERDCFGLTVPDGDVDPIAFPAGTTILDDSSGISVPGVGDIAIGDHFSGTGGYSSAVIMRDLSVPPACAANRIGVILPPGN